MPRAILTITDEVVICVGAHRSLGLRFYVREFDPATQHPHAPPERSCEENPSRLLVAAMEGFSALDAFTLKCPTIPQFSRDASCPSSNI